MAPKPKTEPVKVMHKKAHSARSVHGRQQPATTLARQGLKKPKSVRLNALSSRIESTAELAADLMTPFKELEANKKKLRASHTHKSHLVKKFGSYSEAAPVLTIASDIPVQTQPDEKSSESSKKSQESKAQSSHDQMLTKALNNAKSHEQTREKPLKRRHKVAKKLGLSRRATNVGASLAIILMLGGFIAYQNWANLSVRVAASRAGVNASLPGYRPAGFALNKHVTSSPGRVTINFNSSTDNRNFNITQTASDWNSQSLLDNFVAASDQPYQRVDQPNGKTIYTYGDANATWVDGGVWYKIEGNSGLSSSQLVNIANGF